MNILHIADYTLEFPTGVKTVVEQIILYQTKLCNVKKINLRERNLKRNIEMFYKILLEDSIEIVIIHGIYKIEYILLAYILKCKKIPYIIVPHCSFTNVSLNQKRIKKKIFNKFAKSFYINASAIGFLNKKEKENSIIFNNNIKYLPNGVILPKNIKKEKQDSEVSIMYLSRIDKYHKGLDLLLEALYLIKETLKNEKVRINIYGDGDKKNMDFLYSEIIKYGLKDIVKYKGRVIKDEKVRAFKQNDLFILTSRFEGFPMSVLEALSYGVPCILTKGTNMEEMIQRYNSGWICETEVNEISKLILHALSEYKKNKNKYIEASLKNAKEYEWEKIVKIHLEIYKKLLKI